MHRFSPFQVMQADSVDRYQNDVPDRNGPDPKQLETPVSDEPSSDIQATEQMVPEKQTMNDQETASKTSLARTGDLPADRTTCR